MNAPIGCYTSAQESRFLSVNQTLAVMIGYDTPQELNDCITDIGMQVYADPKDREQVKNLIETRGETHNYECRWLRRNGRVIWVALNLKAVPDQTGKIAFYLGFVSNITQRKHAESSLRESELRFRKMLSLIPDMISIHDRDMNIVYSNWKFFNVPEERKIPGSKCFETYRGFDRICPDCRTTSVLNTKMALQEEVALPGGFWIDLRIMPILDKEGNVNLIVEWVRDITEFKNAQDNKNLLLETERQYRLLFDSSDSLVFIVNREGDFLSSNPKLYTRHGFLNEIEMLGMPYAALHSQEETAIFMGHLDTVFKTGASIEYESFDKHFDMWFSNALSPIRDPEKGDVYAVGGVSRDITERMKKEKELQQAYDVLRETRNQLIQKDKMASLGRLASGVAHEIRNPMEIILMGIDYLENNMPEDDVAGHKSIERIYNAIERVNRIINDILKFSKKTVFVIERVNICSLIEQVMELSEHHLKKNGIEIIKKYPAGDIEVAANKNMLEQVLLNLVNNAADAMEDTASKTLTIHVHQTTVSEVGYKTGYRKTDYFKIGDHMVVINIADTGKGMDEDVLTKLFEPFYTTKETGKGTGLGLSISHMIMDRMRGTIDVESRVGKGSAFFVKLQPSANIETFAKDEANAPEKSFNYR
jgi:PAS domain S-box-containing protein